MAVTEVSGLMKYKDADGNVYLMLPITTKENVDGMEEIDAHLVDTNNPHGVTAEQIGADPSGAAAQALADSKSYTDDEVAGLRDELGAQADWNQNDSTKSDFINNRPFYETDPEEVVIAEGTIPVSGMLQVPANNVTTLTLGETYTVVFDGTTYSDLTCVSVDGLPAVGSSDFSYTDYPFVFAVQNGTTIGMAGDGSVSHTMKVSGYTTEIVQLDRKYIADHIDAFPGEKVSGKNYTIDGESVTAGVGAEVFNDYEKNIASGGYSHVEGLENTASGRWAAHAEGYSTVASGSYSHSEGQHTTASGSSSHAEGYYARATNEASHAEGFGTEASGHHSHAEGDNAFAKGQRSHAEGYGTEASGDNSHAEGWCTKASGENQHVQGKFNIEDADDKYSHIVGNGSGTSSRSNAHTIDWDGTGWFAEGLQVGGAEQDGEGVGYVPAISSAQVGQVVAVKSVDANGKPTGWEAINVSAGSGGGAAIIDVTELPSENINEDVFYRLLTGTIIFNGESFSGWTCHCVESLPETGEMVYDGTNAIVYYNKQDGAAYGYVPDAMAAQMGATAGWYTLDVLAPMMDMPYGGVVVTAEGTAADTVYILLSYELYYYKDGWRKAGVTSWNDLQNRPFYKAESWSINYDPKTFAGDTYIDVGNGMRLLLVSDMTPSNDELKECEGTMISDGSAQTAPISEFWEYCEQQGTITDAYAYFQFGMVVRDAAVATPVGMAPQIGTYFLVMDASNYVSKLTAYEIKTLDPMFLPEMTGVGWNGSGSNAEVFNNENNVASGAYSHAEGRLSLASGDSAHVEGFETRALGNYSHAEGRGTIASGEGSHAEGGFNTYEAGGQIYVSGEAGATTYISNGVNSIPTKRWIGCFVSLYSDAIDQELYTIVDVDQDQYAITLDRTLNANEALVDACIEIFVHSIASGDYSHAEGYKTIASGKGSHAEGSESIASGDSSHAGGRGGTASGYNSFAHGGYAYGGGAVAFSGGTASGDDSFAFNGRATGDGAVSFGGDATGDGSVAFVGGTASGVNSYASGSRAVAIGTGARSVGDFTLASGSYSHAEGSNYAPGYGNGYGDTVKLIGDAGVTTYVATRGGCPEEERNDLGCLKGTFLNYYNGFDDRVIIAEVISVDDEQGTITLDKTLREKYRVDEDIAYVIRGGIASGSYSHSEGAGTSALGRAAHAEGLFTKAYGDASRACGFETVAIGDGANAKGKYTIANGQYSSAEGRAERWDIVLTHTSPYLTVENVDVYPIDDSWTGQFIFIGSSMVKISTVFKDTNQISLATVIPIELTGANKVKAYRVKSGAYGYYSHAEGNCTLAEGISSHAEGWGTVAVGDNQHVQGEFNVEDAVGKYAHIVGNGTSDSDRSNAHTVDWDGNGWFAGSVEATALILKSSTEGSTKRFKITVDDSGTITATKYTE